MGLFANGVDAMAMSMEMRKSVRQWETCMVVILDPGVNQAYFRGKSANAFVWSGMARYQPYRREVIANAQTNPTTMQSARFQVDFSEDGVLPEIKTGYRVWVLPESLSGIEPPDPYISLYDHVVSASANSSLAWVRTIETEFDTEGRPNYQIASDGSGGWEWV